MLGKPSLSFLPGTLLTSFFLSTGAPAQIMPLWPTRAMMDAETSPATHVVDIHQRVLMAACLPAFAKQVHTPNQIKVKSRIVKIRLKINFNLCFNDHLSSYIDALIRVIIVFTWSREG